MTTVVELEIPAARLGFDRTFDRVSTFEFQVGGMIGDSPPLIWASGPDRDSYCGSCRHFEYVQTEQGMQPYCGFTDDLMDDMDACDDYTPRK